MDGPSLLMSSFHPLTPSPAHPGYSLLPVPPPSLFFYFPDLIRFYYSITLKESISLGNFRLPNSCLQVAEQIKLNSNKVVKMKYKYQLVLNNWSIKVDQYNDTCLTDNATQNRV